MAPAPVIKKNTKPLKPYRRGETLGKASRAGKLPRQPKPAAPKEVEPQVGQDEVSEEDQDHGGDGDDANEDTVSAQSEPVRRKKKGKKFVGDSGNALLSLVASITAESETIKKTKIAKQKPFKTRVVAPSKPKDKSKESDAAKKLRLEAAKAAVVNAKAQLKKAKQTDEDRATQAASTVTDDSRKRVSFA